MQIVFILIILIVFGLPLFLFIKLLKGKAVKQKASSWKGQLIDKEHLEYEDDDSAYTKDLYTLKFKTTENEQIKINVSQKIYDEWKKGDKAEKTEGKLLPDKIVI